MNIISGKAKGIRLDVPKGLSVRPTSVMARKAIFDSIGYWSGLIVVDLFAGSGALGLEAASRGAEKVYFSEAHPFHCKILSQNINRVLKSGVSAELKLVKSDSLNFYKFLPELKEKVNIIFADPPYNEATKVIDVLFNDCEFSRWANNALFILECPSEKSRKPVILNLDYWKIEQVKTKGQSEFYFLKSNK